MALDRCPTCHRRRKRSTDANRRLWALYGALSDKLRPDGNVYSPMQYHLYYRQKLLGAVDYALPGGKTVTTLNSTADLDVEQFAAYMEAVEADAAERGVWLDE